MSQVPDAVPASPGDENTWSAARWEPSPEVVPLPVQRLAADPLVPGWGVTDGAVTAPDGGGTGAVIGDPTVVGRAPDPDDPVTPREPSAGRTRPMAWVALGAVLLGGLVYGGVVVAGRMVTHSVEQQIGQVPAVRVAMQLVAAGRAMDLYRADAGAYPTDPAQATSYGYTPQSDVTIQVVPVSGSGYCLAGGPAGGTPTAWYSGTTVSQTPCG
jgi:hypothetical protein